MRIAMVSEHASPLAVLGGQDAGGQNVHVAALSRALATRGHQVRVYTRRDDPRLAPYLPFAPGVEVVHVPAGPARQIPKDDLLEHMAAMGRWIAQDWHYRGAPDLVHAHFWMSGLATDIAVRAERSRPATAITFHALGAVKRRHQGANDTSPQARVGIERGLVHRMDAVIATCTDELAELLAQGADPRRLHVVPCGVDPATFTPHGPRLVPWSPGSHRLLCLGRLVERKGIQTAIEALAGVPDAELVVAGGPDGTQLDDDSDVARLRQVARAVGVSARVRFVGRVDPGPAAALLRAADLVLAVPWYEPFGIVPLEAMACGTTVVASAVGGMLDTVEHAVTGEHVPPRDPQALADCVNALLARPDELTRRGRRSVKRITGQFSWQHVAATTEAVYAEVLRVDQMAGPAIDLRAAAGRPATGPVRRKEAR